VSECPLWVFELLRLFGDGDACDELRWRDDGDGLVFRVDCSDTFWWGTADSENVTEADLPELHRAVADARGCPGGEDLWPVLWCARKRGMRPMNAFYRSPPSALAALFDAAGPARPPTLVAP
jgi:hypothetical protein